MPEPSSPDGRLVYLHCSSIFNGANAQLRKSKKIIPLLQKHKASIKILTKEFTIQAIATVAKELLEAQIFESSRRAKLRYPELFQSSEKQDADRAASEAEIIRAEAEAAQEIAVTSEGEEGLDCLDLTESQLRAEPEKALEASADAAENDKISVVDPSKEPAAPGNQTLSIPRLHPVYLPFKTQHRILVLVQSLLEKSCLDFGNIWVPDLMQARKWHEAESIELTEWTKRFSKHAKFLPPSAIKSVTGKSTAEILFGTSTLRHSAVHRLPTSALGILNMLAAAVTFSEALNDTERAEKVAGIRTIVEACVEEIVQHQNLVERKLKDQLEEIARRRAELDELERVSIEEMLATDKEKRSEAGSVIESFLLGSNQALEPCACLRAQSLDGAQVSDEADEETENRKIIDEQQFERESIKNSSACDENPCGGEDPCGSEKIEQDVAAPVHDCNRSDIQEEREISEVTLSPFEPDDETKNDQVIVSGSEILAKQSPIMVDISVDPVHVSEDVGFKGVPHPAWEFSWNGPGPTEPHIGAEQAVAIEEIPPAAPIETCAEGGPFCIVSKDEAVPVEEVIEEVLAPLEEPVAEDSPCEAEVIRLEDFSPTERAKLVAGLDMPVYELVTEHPSGFWGQTPHQETIISYESSNNLEPPLAPDFATISGSTAEDAQRPKTPPSPALSAPLNESDLDSPLSAKTPSAQNHATPKVPTDVNHTIALDIFYGSEILRAIMCIEACTRTAILQAAKAYCEQGVRDNPGLETLLGTECNLMLVSLKLYGHDMDLSTYKLENLGSLMRTAEKLGIPRFRVRIVEG